MNDAHLHLLTNHFPIIGTIFSTLILAYALIFKNLTLKNTALVGFILTALLSIPAYTSGEGAKEILESIGQDNHHFIHEHEELAGTGMLLCVSLGILSLGILLLRKNPKKYFKILIIVILLGGIIDSTLMLVVGNSGGEIRHTEIRDGNNEN
jgi:hypothetical protein